MFAWISNNLGTILITLVLIPIVAGVIYSVVGRKKGKTFAAETAAIAPWAAPATALKRGRRGTPARLPFSPLRKGGHPMTKTLTASNIRYLPSSCSA